MGEEERRIQGLHDILLKLGDHEGRVKKLEDKIESEPHLWANAFQGHRAEIADHIEKIENRIDERLSRIESKIEELLERPSLAEITGEGISDIAINYGYLKDLRKDRKETAVSFKRVTVGTIVTGAFVVLMAGIKALWK